MNVFRTIAERIKHGYKIADDCYLSGGTRDSIVIKFKGKKIEIFMERQPGAPSILIYPSKVRKWLPPYDNESVLDDEYNLIIDALVRSLEGDGEVVQIPSTGYVTRKPGSSPNSTA